MSPQPQTIHEILDDVMSNRARLVEHLECAQARGSDFVPHLEQWIAQIDGAIAFVAQTQTRH